MRVVFSTILNAQYVGLYHCGCDATVNADINTVYRRQVWCLWAFLACSVSFSSLVFCRNKALLMLVKIHLIHRIFLGHNNIKSVKNSVCSKLCKTSSNINVPRFSIVFIAVKMCASECWGYISCQNKKNWPSCYTYFLFFLQIILACSHVGW